MSTYVAPVVKLNLEKHPDADTLSIQKVDDFQVVARTEDWAGIEYGIYIPPDSIVDASRPEFAWLDPNGGKVRIKAKRLRGVWSMGLMVPAPAGVTEGEDFYERLGIEHYEPDEPGQSGVSTATNAPVKFSHLTKYDVENGRKSSYSRMFVPGEEVYVTEKIHGQNMAAVFTDGAFHIKSRNEWKKEESDSLYWRALKNNPRLMQYLQSNPDMVVYGEQYGHIKGFPYDCKPGEVKFRAFDIRKPDGLYIDASTFVAITSVWEIPTVPAFILMPFDMTTLLALAESKSPLGSKLMEGIVVKPLKERRDVRHGRVVMKIVNPAYLEKN